MADTLQLHSRLPPAARFLSFSLSFLFFYSFFSFFPLLLHKDLHASVAQPGEPRLHSMPPVQYVHGPNQRVSLGLCGSILQACALAACQI